MSAQIQFFCTVDEEARVLSYLRDSGDVSMLSVLPHVPYTIREFDSSAVPAWPNALELLVWLRPAGNLVWHTERPKLPAASATHGELPAQTHAQLAWDEARPSSAQRLLDSERSPVLKYERGRSREGQIGPCLIYAPPSDLNLVPPAYAKWVNRIIGWVRRHSKLVHNWERSISSLPNPHKLLNSIYAFPNAYTELESGQHPFAVLVS